MIEVIELPPLAKSCDKCSKKVINEDDLKEAILDSIMDKCLHRCQNEDYQEFYDGLYVGYKKAFADVCERLDLEEFFEIEIGYDFERLPN